MSAARTAIAASHVFDGVALHRDTAVLIDGTSITALLPRADVPANAQVRALPDGLWLAPGFIDTQVNGGGGVLLNDDPTPKGISAIVSAHRKFGTTALLPTLITDLPETTSRAIRAADEAAASMPGVLGIHLEGPFLSPERPGVHDPRRLRRPGDNDLAIITAKRRGVTLVTLAPEQVPNGFIAALAAAGVRVALGHSMATYAQTRSAMADGLTGFTHLFNAMRPLASREPGPITAALEEPAAWFGMIVDGVHVDPAVLRLALRGLARWPLFSPRRHAGGLDARHGQRRAQLRRSAGRAAHRCVALCVIQPGEFSGAGSYPREARAGLSRRSGRIRSDHNRGRLNLGGRREFRLRPARLHHPQRNGRSPTCDTSARFGLH